MAAGRATTFAGDEENGEEEQDEEEEAEEERKSRPAGVAVNGEEQRGTERTTGEPFCD